MKTLKTILSAACITTLLVIPTISAHELNMNEILKPIPASETNYLTDVLLADTSSTNVPNYGVSEVAAFLEDNHFSVPKETSDNQQLTNGLLPAGTPVSPTPPAKARAAVTENVGANNKAFVAPSFKDTTPVSSAASSSTVDYSIKSDPNGIVVHDNKATNKKKDEPSYIEKRQFVTITTRSGKQFYLIINHEAEGQEAQLLTEVSEQDLLNMIVEQPKYKKAASETIVEKIQEPVETTQQTVVVPEQPKSSNSLFYWFLVLGGIGLLVWQVMFKHPEYLEPIKRKFKKQDPQDEYDDKENAQADDYYSYYNAEAEESEEASVYEQEDEESSDSTEEVDNEF